MMSGGGSAAKRLVGLIASVCCATAMAVPAGLAWATPARGKWTMGSTPADDKAALTAVSCASRTTCVTVGTVNAGFGGRPIVYRWDGSRWASLPLPAGAKGGVFAAIACPSTSYCVAVGGNSRVHAQAWSWNGRSWSDQPTYYPTSAFSVLSGIECVATTSCEAVGVTVSRTDADLPLAEHWNGTLWADQPSVGVPDGGLSGVSCGSSTNCEAVGYTDIPNRAEATLAMRLNGSTWVVEDSPTLPGKGDGYELTAVSCYSNGCTAVGYSQSGLLISEAWRGGKWLPGSPVGAGSPPGSKDAEWNAIQCRSASSCTAAGAWDDGTRPFLTLVDVWNGKLWTKRETPSPSAYGDELVGLSCISRGWLCTAVGDAQASSSERQSDSLVIRN
jgi:hypothetical protein